MDELKACDNDMIASHIGRSVGMRVVTSGKYFLGDGEIVATPYFIFLAHPKRRKGVVIRDRAMVQIVYEVLSMLYDAHDLPQGPTSVDLNGYLRSVLERRQRGTKS